MNLPAFFLLGYPGCFPICRVVASPPSLPLPWGLPCSLFPTVLAPPPPPHYEAPVEQGPPIGLPPCLPHAHPSLSSPAVSFPWMQSVCSSLFRSPPASTILSCTGSSILELALAAWEDRGTGCLCLLRWCASFPGQLVAHAGTRTGTEFQGPHRMLNEAVPLFIPLCLLNSQARGQRALPRGGWSRTEQNKKS